MSNLGQIKSLIRVKISQTDTTNTDFTDQELTGFVNEGQRFLGALVKKPIDHVEIQVQQDYPAYTLPNDTILLNTAYFGDVSINGDVRPLTITTEEALKEANPNWMDETTNSQGRPTRIVLIDRVTVLISPRPNAAEGASGKKLHIGYVYQPAILTNDSDTPDLPIVYHDLLADYGHYMCCLSKLNKPELATAILSQMMDKAKKLEPLIIKETNSFGFSWGGGFDPNDDNGSGLRFSF